MPPQIEDLLLSSSEQARRLSPFATPEGVGGARVAPESQHAFEVGFGYEHPSRFWFGLSGRYESGPPLEVELDELDELRERPGAELVNFERGRIEPRALFDFSLGKDFFSDRRVTLRTQFDIRNLTNRRFAYNFGNPFSGTHFGHPRMWSGRIRFGF